MDARLDAGPEVTVADSLRRATAEHHRRVESFLRLEPPLERVGYIEALQAFEHFLDLWEPRVRKALPARLRGWFASRSRHELAYRDLAQLGIDGVHDPAVRAACAVHVSRIPLDTPAAVFGSIYVMEGSALGGRIIARRAEQSLGLTAHFGAAYFHGADATAAHWRGFLLTLEREVGSESRAREEAQRAAIQTFDAFLGVLDRLRHASPSC